MKHENSFNEFLKNHVNLNQSRLDRLERSVNAVRRVLQSNLDGFRKISSQGSYAHGTIIKPVQENDEFDADILVFIKDDHFDPTKYSTDYVWEVYQILKNDDNYKNKLVLNSRCLTIDYANDYHLDVVPCIEHGDEKYICNRENKIYEPTDGDGYKTWLTGKNSITNRNYLKKVVRILKFLRDHKDNFSITSILLTTLLGTLIDNADRKIDQFLDFPDSLRTLSNKLDRFLQSNPQMPRIENPVLPNEDFNRKWNQSKYLDFRQKFHVYNDKINSAFDEKNHDMSVKKWRELFGNEFGILKDSGSKSNAAVVGGATAVFSAPTVAATKPYAKDD